MTSNSTATDTTQTRTNWQVDYDADPIEIRDPVAEALDVLEEQDAEEELLDGEIGDE